MEHASFFTGGGGFDLAAEWIGWNNVFSCEVDKFCNTITRFYWPDKIEYHDIRTTDFTIHRNKIDVITGGFPCQPYSINGKREGTADPRHLWPEMLRGIQQIQSPWVVGENVRGIINWQRGMVFDQVQTDLEASGYETIPFLLPASGVNASHERYRTIFVAYSHHFAESRRLAKIQEQKEKIKKRITVSEPGNTIGILENYLADPYLGRSQKCNVGAISNKPVNAAGFHYAKLSDWNNFPTQPPFVCRNNGFPFVLDGITVSQWRNKSIELFGNAVVPEMILEVFKAIEKYNELVTHD